MLVTQATSSLARALFVVLKARVPSLPLVKQGRRTRRQAHLSMLLLSSYQRGGCVTSLGVMMQRGAMMHTEYCQHPY
jgi:hypothetical protein